jgi:hypothetical protein
MQRVFGFSNGTATSVPAMSVCDLASAWVESTGYIKKETFWLRDGNVLIAVSV